MIELKSRILRSIASIGAGVVLAGSVGVAGASFSGHHGGGHHGGNDDGVETSVTNNSTVGVTNDTDQNATSGEAVVNNDDGCNKTESFGRSSGHHGHHGDDCDEEESSDPSSATTGDASNDNTTGISVAIANTGACDCLPGLDGGDDDGSVKTTITNNNTVGVTNTTNQTATSGNATVNGSGSATTGSASNANTTTIGVSVSN